jgi:hypothetical protein
VRYLIGAVIFPFMLVAAVYFGRGHELRGFYVFIAAIVVFALFAGLELKRK